MAEQHTLILRSTVIGGKHLKNDYSVHRDGYEIGCIRLHDDHVGHREEWAWHVNPPLPIPAWAHGAAATLDAAKAEFRAAWERFYARLRPADIEYWHDVVAGLEERERNRGKPLRAPSSMMRCVCGVHFDSHVPAESYDHRAHIYAAQAREQRW